MTKFNDETSKVISEMLVEANKDAMVVLTKAVWDPTSLPEADEVTWTDNTGVAINTGLVGSSGNAITIGPSDNGLSGISHVFNDFGFFRVLHNLSGPACFYDHSIEPDYYIHGQLMSKSEWEVHPERLTYIKEQCAIEIEKLLEK